MRNTEHYLCQFCFINCGFDNPSTPWGGVRQCLLSPDILTTGGVHKRKKCIQKCWECSHEKLYKQLLGVFPWKLVGSANTIHPWLNVRDFFLLGSAAGTAALKDMRCKFDVSLHQSCTFWGVSLHQIYANTKLTHHKYKLTNLHVNAVNVYQTYTQKCKFIVASVSLV